MKNYARDTFTEQTDWQTSLDMAIKALEMIEEFERAQIITGGRLNGRTYAYKCGLEDGKRKALEQETILDKIRAEIEEKYGDYDICEWFEDYDYEENDVSEYRSVGDISDILEIIDKYKAERSGAE